MCSFKMLISSKNIHKIYTDGKKKLHVLKGIDISLEKGEISVIVGPSGAGKSTLLHILGGLDEPSSGKVIFDGIDLYGITDSKRSLIRNRRIGFVFQFYHLLPEFSTIENVIMPALIRERQYKGYKESMARAEELVELVGLKARAFHRPSELSGGEKQRVAIARALMNSPDMVLCDEPTGNLDTENSEIFLNLIKELNRKHNQSFLIVTHNEQLAQFTGKPIRMQDGLIV